MLHIHRAERADGLVEALRALLAEPPAPPSPPTPGGCANVDFPSPRRLVGDAVAAASGIDPDADPWLPERRSGRCSRSSTAASTSRGSRSLAAHLGGGEPTDAARARGSPPSATSPTCSTATRCTGPTMLRAWAAGDDTTPTGAGRPSCGGGCARASASPSPAERAGACARLRAEPGARRPARALSLFGLTRLPAGHLDVLRALAAGARRPPVPPPPVARAVGARSPRAASRGRPPRATTTDRGAAPPTRCSPPGARTRARCSSSSRRPDGRRPPPPVVDARDRHAARPHPGRRPRRPRAARRAAARRRRRAPLLDPDDRSLQVHACHGRARQVEVVRDAILHLLADDPTLEPRDVIVMCPDIETFAPLIHATFGAGSVGRRRSSRCPPHRADRPARAARRPLAAPDQPGARRRRAAARPRRRAADRLAGARPRRPRAGAPALPPRRRRPRADRGVGRATSGIRWGLDAAHRAPFKLDALPPARGRRAGTACWSA